MNVIFGSGVVGLLAKLVLGPNWKLVPFAKSRFFSFNPPLDDNFIIRNVETDNFVKEITSTIGDVVSYKYSKAWSVRGQIYNKYDHGICDDWLNKVFGNDVPSQSHAYMKSQMSFDVYDIRVNSLYFSLVNSFKNELVEESKNKVTEIGPHYYISGGVRYEFDKAVSTIPLDALLKLMNIEGELISKPTYYLHIETTDLDFEGNNQLLVSDQMFDFYKVSNIARNRYLLYFNRDAANYGSYLMQFIKKFDILDGTCVKDAIPVGLVPNLKNIEENAGIFCVGSYAQWDWCMDIGSCILRLLRYANRGNIPQKMKKL